MTPLYGFMLPIISMAANLFPGSFPDSQYRMSQYTILKKARNGHGTSHIHQNVCNIELGMGLGTIKMRLFRLLDPIDLLTILFWSPPNDCIVWAGEKEAYRHHTQVLLNKLKQKAQNIIILHCNFYDLQLE